MPGSQQEQELPIYEPEPPSFGEERRVPNVLWGRIVAFGVILLLVFLGGRATAGGGGGSSEEVDDLKARLASAQAEIEQLDRLARSQPTTTLPADPGIGAVTTTLPGVSGVTPTAGSGGAVTTTLTGASAAGETQIYTVKPGDNLGSISSKFYGTSSLKECIAKAQTPPITDLSKLQLNQKLTIPMPKPTAPC